MKKSNVLCIKKFNSMVVATTLALTIATLLALSDTFIGGIMIGEDAISAVSVVSPITLLSVFFACLTSVGSGFIFAKMIGNFDNKRAHSIFSISVVCSIVLGVMLSLLMLLFKDVYFSVLGVSGNVLELSTKYYYCLIPHIAIYPLRQCFSEHVTADGDEKNTMISYITQLIGNFAFSIILCSVMGISGIALGTFVGSLLSLTVNLFSLKKSESNLRFTKDMHIKDIKDIVIASMTDASLYLLMSITDFALNGYVVHRFGEYYLPVLGIAMTILQLTVAFDGIGTGFAPIVNSYLGEGNYHSIKLLMNHVIKLAVIEGLAAMVILNVFTPLIMTLFSLSDPVLYSEAVVAIRIMSLMMVPSAILVVVVSLYNICGHEMTTTIIECFQQTIVPIAFSLTLATFLNIRWMWFGFAISFGVVLVVAMLILRRRWGKEKFPWFLPDDNAVIKNIYCELNSENVIDVQSKMADFLEENGCGIKTSMKIQLIIEELGMMIADKNDTCVLSEWTMMINDEIQLIVRYDGESLNLIDKNTDDDSVRSMVLSNIMHNQENKNYLMSTGFNRCVFGFSK